MLIILPMVFLCGGVFPVLPGILILLPLHELRSVRIEAECINDHAGDAEIGINTYAGV